MPGAHISDRRYDLGQILDTPMKQIIPICRRHCGSVYGQKSQATACQQTMNFAERLFNIHPPEDIERQEKVEVCR